MAQDFDPVEVLVQSGSSCCGMMSSAALVYGATRFPPPMAIKAYGGAAIGILVLCLVCCLSITYGAERAANQLPGQG
jgi:hypothetical protein